MNEIIEEPLDYYKIGSRDNIVVSSSSLSYIDPTQGGNPKKFLSFFDQNIEKETSVSLEKGSLIHLWCEKKDEFYVSEIDKPTDMNCIWVDKVLEFKKTIPFTQGQITTDNIILTSKASLNIHNNLKDTSKILEKYNKECLPYEQDILKGEGKISISKSNKEMLDKIIENIKNHPVANNLLFGDSFNNTKRYKEEVICWEVNGVTCKSKLDNILIDLDNKIVTIIDVKSTSKSKYNYIDTFKYYHVYRQLAFYNLAIQYSNNINYNLKNIDNFLCYIILVETTGNNDIAVIPVSNKWLILGLEEINSLLDRIKWHTDNNLWEYSKEEYENNFYLNIEEPE